MDRHCDEWRAALQADSRFASFPDEAGRAPSVGATRQVLGFTKTAA
jgi:hypothetical protein